MPHSQSRSGSSVSNKSKKSKKRSNSRELQVRKSENSQQKVDQRCLYIGNIDRKCTQQQVKELFLKYGPMEYCFIVYEPGTGTNSKQAKISRGYGFAKYHNNSDAQKAKASLEGKQLFGRNLNLQVSKRDKPRQSTPGRYLGRKKTSPLRRDDRRDRDRDRYRRRSYSRSYSQERRHKKHHEKEKKQKYSDRDGRRQRHRDRSQQKKSKRKRESHSRSYSQRR